MSGGESRMHGVSAERAARALLGDEAAGRLLALLGDDTHPNRASRLSRDRRSSARELLEGPGGALEEAALLLRIEEALRALAATGAAPPEPRSARSRWRLARTLRMALEARPERRTTLPEGALRDVLADLEACAEMALDLSVLRTSRRPDPLALERAARSLEMLLSHLADRGAEAADFHDLHQSARRLAESLAPIHDEGLPWRERLEAAVGLSELAHHSVLTALAEVVRAWRGVLFDMLAAAAEDAGA